MQLSRRTWRAGLRAVPAAVVPLSGTGGAWQREAGWTAAGWLPLLLTVLLLGLMIGLILLAIRDFRSYQQRDSGSGRDVLRDPRTRFRRVTPADDEPDVDEPDEVDDAEQRTTWLPRLRDGAVATAALAARAIAGLARLPTLAGGLLRRTPVRDDADEEHGRSSGTGPGVAARPPLRRNPSSAVPEVADQGSDDWPDDDEDPVDWDDLPGQERRRWEAAVDGELPPPAGERRPARLPAAERERWDDALSGDSYPAESQRNAVPAAEQARWQRAVDTGKTLGSAAPAAADRPIAAPPRAAGLDDDDALLEDLLGR